jgi:hypothetical protein
MLWRTRMNWSHAVSLERPRPSQRRRRADIAVERKSTTAARGRLVMRLRHEEGSYHVRLRDHDAVRPRRSRAIGFGRES